MQTVVVLLGLYNTTHKPTSRARDAGVAGNFVDF